MRFVIHKKFEAEALKRADRMVSEMKLTNIESIKIGVLRKNETNELINKADGFSAHCAHLF